MNFTVSGEKVKKYYLADGRQVKKFDVEENGQRATVYKAEQVLVDNSTLQSGTTLTNVINRSGTSKVDGTYLEIKAYGGAQFGLNITKCDTDIRGYSKITGRFTPRAISGGNNGYYNIGMVIGTASEINSITYPSYGNLNTGTCDVIVKQVFTTANAYNIDFEVPISRQTASEPVYIAFCLCAYNSGTNYLTINKIVLE